MVSGIVSLISLSDLPLLVYGNTTDFCILILFPIILLNSLTSLSMVSIEVINANELITQIAPNISFKQIFDILNTPRAQNIYKGFTDRSTSEEFCKTCTYANRFLG